MGVKLENEVTVEVSISKNKILELLESQGFELREEFDIKDIYMLEGNYNSSSTARELLKKCVLIRDIIFPTYECKMLTYKNKEYNSYGDIVKQKNVNCEISSIKSAKEFLEAINYKEFIKLNNHSYLMVSDEEEMAVQVVGKHVYIEMEEYSEAHNKRYKNIDEMKKVFDKYNIPIKNNDYFVKKAEIAIKEEYDI